MIIDRRCAAFANVHGAFLTSRPAFENFFSTADLATRFYKEFGCGLHHNAQVFRDGLVWSVGPLLRLDGQRMVRLPAARTDRDQGCGCATGRGLTSTLW